MQIFVKKFLAINVIIYLFGINISLAAVKHGKNKVKNNQSTSEILPESESDKGFYFKARTFFINDDLVQAKMAIDQHLLLFPEDLQANKLKNIIELHMKQSNCYSRQTMRADMLTEVNNAWEMPIVQDDARIADSRVEEDNNIQNKLSKIIFPKIRFINIPISTVVETISEMSVQYDTTTDDENLKGINIVLVASNVENEPKINLNLRNVTLERLLFYTAQASNYRCDYTQDAVIIGDPQAMQEQLEMRFFAVSRATIIKLTGLQGLNHKSTDNQVVNEHDEEQAIKSFFIRAGVDFSIPGSNMAFDGVQLIVTNNLKNLHRIERILQKYSETKQVEIEAKFLEVTQGTLDELAFRWNVLNRFNNDRGGISTGSGTTDNLRTMGQAFAPSVSSSGDGKIVIDTKEINLRNQPPQLSGQINLGTSSVPFGSFLGVVDRAQVSMMMRALEQNSGSDLMSAPKLTVLSGKTANIVVAQELRYPQNYGETHSEVGNGSTLGLTNSSSAGVTITAGTPKDFTTRNIGVEMKVTPIVEGNNNISLQLEPKVTEFEGFMEYGGMSVAVTGGATVSVPSGFYQPIFSTRAIQTEVTVQNGSTVIMGGLTREEVKEVRDKIPVLGSIPLLGKLFRSKSETSQKRNLLIFVTARTVSPNGARYKPEKKESNFKKILLQ